MRYFSLNKPFGFLSQFTQEGGHPTLGDLHKFPPNVYPVGRLDRDSEGLLLLTDDTSINAALLHPSKKHKRTYYVQVEGVPSQEDLERFTQPMVLKAKGKTFKTSPAQAELLEGFEYHDRNPPIRERANIPTSWLALTLTEGKNRQVRKMTAAIGFPTLRLVRWNIEDLDLELNKGNAVREWTEEEFRKLLHL